MLFNKKAAVKISGAMLIAVIAIVAVVAIAYQQGYLGGVVPGAPSPSPPVPAQGMVDVTKQLKLVVLDKHGGAAATGTTDAINIYDSTGKNTLETGLDLSSGTVTSANTYASGTVIYVRYYYDTTIDEYMWWKVTVPKMSAADAESLTTNAITLFAFSSPAFTDSMMDGAGNTYTNNAVLNTTGSSNDVGTFTYSYYVSADNTGFISSYDPTYDVQLQPVIWATLSGTGYETISLTGFDGGFEKGTTMYYYKVIPDDSITKWKVGNTYQLSGAGATTFGYNAVGYSNSTTAYATLTVYLKLYSNPAYMQTYGSYGPYAFTGESTAVRFEDQT